MTIIKGTMIITTVAIKGTINKTKAIKIKVTNKTIQTNMALSVAVAVVAAIEVVVAAVAAAAMADTATTTKRVTNNRATGLGNIFCTTTSQLFKFGQFFKF